MFGHATYLVFELAWALPVLLVQWIAGGGVLWRSRATWGLGCLLPTLYLCACDDWAIASGIWHINAARTLGLRPLGLPLEEAIFFLVTNAMVVQTVILLGDGQNVRVPARLRRALRRRRGNA